MAALAGLPEIQKPLDEAVWQAWIARTRAQDRRGYQWRANAVKWIAISALFVAPYHVVIRFIVTAGALAVLYNPVLPALTFSGAWQFALIAASTLPFAASLAWRNVRLAQHD